MDLTDTIPRTPELVAAAAWMPDLHIRHNAGRDYDASLLAMQCAELEGARDVYLTEPRSRTA